MTKTKLRVLCFGEAMVELSSLNFNKKVAQITFAGDTLNTAVYLKRLLGFTADVDYLTVIGKDYISEEMHIIDLIDINTKGSFNKVSINKEGKEAKSIFKPLKRYSGSSLIEIQILTGRTHQIRAQCEKINKNIANDNKYGCSYFNKHLKNSGIKRLGLHSYEISFLDLKEKRNTFFADYDDEFENILSYLKT